MPDSVERKLTFRRPRTEVVDSTSPEALFGDLPKLPARVAPLWGHQTDQLRSYYNNYVDSPDVALELPTGSGKTLMGLLIAEWRRRHFKERTVYVCPTLQLARQAAEKAENQGIAVARLLGGASTWDQRELNAYERGEKLAISVYSSIFNSHPKIKDAATIVFDDAHAAENYVAKAWSVEIDREESVFASVIEVLRPSLDASLVARLISEDQGRPGVEAEVRLIPPTTIMNHETELESVLGGFKDSRKLAFGMISGRLPACCFYISARSILIRPMVAPTTAHEAFISARQRVYLSATLGAAGELERSFGRPAIERIPVPEEYSRTGGGRRFFVFPELAEKSAAAGAGIALIKELVAKSSKQVILGQSEKQVTRLADELEIPADHRFIVKEQDGTRPGQSFGDFVKAETGTLLAANRYDGMDLKDGICRMLIIEGLPSAMNQQDAFLLTRVHAGEVLAERLRTRILQGVGRCTRGPKDYSVVVVADSELTSFLSKAENLQPLLPEVQAELRFGIDVSYSSAEDIPDLVASALAQDSLWQSEAEPEIARLRSESASVAPVSAPVLQTASKHEVGAWAAAWRRDWPSAIRQAITVCERLMKDQGLRSYRALWSFLAAEFIGMSEPTPGSAMALKRTELLAEAHLLTSRATWLREIARDTEEMYDPAPMDLQAANGVVAQATGQLKTAHKLERTVAEMLERLASVKSTSYEQGLVALGAILGAESFKPKGQGRTDAVWKWDDLWITLEAKSEQKSDGLVSMDYVRQANTQLKSLASDVGVASAPVGSVTVIVSPRLVADPDAVVVADDHLYLVAPNTVLGIALEAKRAWESIRSLSMSGTASAAIEVAGILWEHRLLPDQLRERLTLQRIK